MLALGMVTGPCPGTDPQESIGHLRWGGFDEPVHVFCEPGTPEVRPRSDLVVQRNEVRLGALGNWKQCLTWLRDQTTAGYLMVCMDDISYARGARQAWERAVGRFERVGLWSLYTARRDPLSVGQASGWAVSDHGPDDASASALCFPRTSAELLLKYAPLCRADLAPEAPAAVVARCFREAGLLTYSHTPSLAEPMGRRGFDNSKPESAFPGLGFDRNYEPGSTTEDRPAPPTFHEQWYTESELDLLKGAVRFVRPLPGAIIEFGCWEGRSTATITNACDPEPVLAIDTWAGSDSEGADHPTVRLAQVRDVFAIFQENMRRLTRGNVVPRRTDVMTFLRTESGPIKFCHIDAAHDYASVRDSLELLLPRLVRGGILIGHDYQAAHAGRGDLQGGVERAVREVLPRHAVRGNNWWYVHLTPD